MSVRSCEGYGEARLGMLSSGESELVNPTVGGEEYLVVRIDQTGHDDVAEPNSAISKLNSLSLIFSHLSISDTYPSSPGAVYGNVLPRRHRHGLLREHPTNPNTRLRRKPVRNHGCPAGRWPASCCDQVGLRPEECARRVGQPLCRFWRERCECIIMHMSCE